MIQWSSLIDSRTPNSSRTSRESICVCSNFRTAQDLSCDSHNCQLRHRLEEFQDTPEASRSPLRLCRQGRELILPSDRCFRLICTDCPDWTDSRNLAFSFRLKLAPDLLIDWTDCWLCSDEVSDFSSCFPSLCVTLECTKPSYTSPCTDQVDRYSALVCVSCEDVSMTEPHWLD